MIGPYLSDSLELGVAVAEQHQPVRARVGAVDDAKAVSGRLHVEDGPHFAVNDGKRREGFHYVRVGLVDQLSVQPSAVVEVEVAVLNQQRYLERRTFG